MSNYLPNRFESTSNMYNDKYMDSVNQSSLDRWIERDTAALFKTTKDWRKEVGKQTNILLQDKPSHNFLDVPSRKTDYLSPDTLYLLTHDHSKIYCAYRTIQNSGLTLSELTGLSRNIVVNACITKLIDVAINTKDSPFATSLSFSKRGWVGLWDIDTTENQKDSEGNVIENTLNTNTAKKIKDIQISDDLAEFVNRTLGISYNIFGFDILQAAKTFLKDYLVYGISSGEFLYNTKSAEYPIPYGVDFFPTLNYHLLYSTGGKVIGAAHNYDLFAKDTYIHPRKLLIGINNQERGHAIGRSSLADIYKLICAYDLTNEKADTYSIRVSKTLGWLEGDESFMPANTATSSGCDENDPNCWQHLDEESQKEFYLQQYVEKASEILAGNTVGAFPAGLSLKTETIAVAGASDWFNNRIKYLTKLIYQTLTTDSIAYVGDPSEPNAVMPSYYSTINHLRWVVNKAFQPMVVTMLRNHTEYGKPEYWPYYPQINFGYGLTGVEAARDTAFAAQAFADSPVKSKFFQKLMQNTD